MKLMRQCWNEPWALTVTAGMLLSLSFPPLDLAILQIPAFILLYRLADRDSGWRDFVIKAGSGLLLWNLATTYWLMMATIAGGIAAITANSALMLIPLLIIRALLRTDLHPAVTALLGGAVWVSYEYLHHIWELAWPWLALGNAWSNLPGVIQYISVTGHLGISFWVVLSSIMIYRMILSRQKRDFIYATTLFLLFPALSVITLLTFDDTREEPFEVAVVQPNMDSYLDYGGLAGSDELLTLLLGISDTVRTTRTKLIVWPENALDSAIRRESPLNERIRDSLRQWDTELITGAGFVDYYETGEEPPIVRGQRDGRSWNVYNAALHFSNDQLDIYRKSRLVPIVERLPFAETLQRLDRFEWVSWGDITGYGKGLEANNFNVSGHATPALICYDSVYPQWIGKFVRNGAGFLTIITNDGWWGDTSGHSQHFSYARLRAIEFRQWVVRSANNGISGIISPDGQVQVSTAYWERTAFTHTIYPNYENTFYAIYGDWFSWLMLSLTGFTVILLAVKQHGKSQPIWMNMD